MIHTLSILTQVVQVTKYSCIIMLSMLTEVGEVNKVTIHAL